jgi:alcohol dehydrogenase (cytochrome c)
MMIRPLLLATLIAATGVVAPSLLAEGPFPPVTREMLLNPSPDDWLMYSRTYDNQRFSPLKQINRQNVRDLRLSWSRGLSPGIHQNIPLVYRGVMYVANPGGMQALNATNGDLLWDYRRASASGPVGRAGRTFGIYADLIIYAAPDDAIVAIDATTGKLRWENKIGFSSSGPRIIDGQVMAGINECAPNRDCVVSLDAATGKEVWRFHTTPAPGEPGSETWGNTPIENRTATPWGLPGAYDAVRKMVFWGIANPEPFARLKRSGAPDVGPRSTPLDLYSNSTVALSADTGKLNWYYQHLPGDDWDLDHAQERILLRTAVNPDPASVKWINPRIPRGQARDILVSVSEGGGVWVNDRDGQFLWATPFPYDVPEFHISRIDVETGKTYINMDKVFKKDGDRVVVCFYNTKGHWPMSYHPGKNSLYVSHDDSCLDMTLRANSPSEYHSERVGIRRPGSDPQKFTGLSKINMSTGKVERLHEQPFPGNGAMLTTAGDVFFWGDMNRRFRAFDADSGKILWETILGGIIQMSTITYAVDGRQYVAVLTGDSASGTTGLLRQVPELNSPRGHNAVYVFALPDQR